MKDYGKKNLTWKSLLKKLLHFQPRVVNLDLAAKILIGDPNIDRTENAKFKSKNYWFLLTDNYQIQCNNYADRFAKCINMLNFLQPKNTLPSFIFWLFLWCLSLFSQMRNFFIVQFFFVTAKIRRLYDIANILATLNLIRKIRITDIRDRKPTYQYIGPDLEQVHELNGWYI